MVAIGIHNYGGVLNSATVIGRYGVSLSDYIAIFSLRDTARPPPRTMKYAWKALQVINIPLDTAEQHDDHKFAPLEVDQIYETSL